MYKQYLIKRRKGEDNDENKNIFLSSLIAKETGFMHLLLKRIRSLENKSGSTLINRLKRLLIVIFIYRHRFFSFSKIKSRNSIAYAFYN